MPDREFSTEQVQRFINELNALQDRYGLVAMSADKCCGGYRVDVIGSTVTREFETAQDEDTKHWSLRPAVPA